MDIKANRSMNRCFDDMRTEGTYTRRGHTRNAYRENIHMEGTYTWRDIHMNEIPVRGHAKRAQSGHTHGGDILTEGSYRP